MKGDLEFEVPSHVFKEVASAGQSVRILVHDENGRTLAFYPRSQTAAEGRAAPATERWPKPTWQGRTYY